LVFPFFIPEC